MDILQELFQVMQGLPETEEALKETDKQLLEFIDSNMPEDCKRLSYDTISSIYGNREIYFFKAGFKTAVRVLME